MNVGSAEKGVSTPRRRSWLGPLWQQVLIGILLGIVVGVLSPNHAIALKPLGDGFIKLIRMTLAPLSLPPSSWELRAWAISRRWAA